MNQTIYWTIQSRAAHPALAYGLPPAGVLDAGELATFLRFKVDKRRREWLLGRWTAKRLLAGLPEAKPDRGETNSFAPVPHALLLTPAATEKYHLLPIRNDDAGRPYTPARPVTLSLSHSGEWAAAAVVWAMDWPLGIDLEQIAPRPAAFGPDYFTLAERAQVEQTPAGDYDQFLTILWSAKEAALKALGLGLSVDTRAVTVWVGGDPGACPHAGRGNHHREPAMTLVKIGEDWWIGNPGGQTQGFASTWGALAISCDSALLPRPAPALTGWWRIIGDNVLTIVTGV